MSASIVALAVGACDDRGPSEPPPGPPVDSVASVDVSPDTPTLVALGETVELSATPHNAQGDSLAGKTVTWVSSDTDVAEIDSNGIATAVTNGTTTITATIDGATGTAELTVSQQGTTLRIAIKPAGAAAGMAFDIQPVVQVVDANGNIATNDDTTTVTASIASGEGEIVGTESATAQAGVAMFTDMGVRGRIGERTLRFEADGLDAAVSDAFTLAAGPSEALHIRVEPGSAEAGSPLNTQPVIEIHDANGNIAAGDDATIVTASIASGGGSITGDETATAEAGVATFTDLAIDGDAGERTLRFEAEGVTAAVSEPFTLSASAPEAEALHIRVEPAGARAGEPLGTPPVIEIRDANGDVVADDNTTVITASIASGGGSIISGETTTVEAGVARFADLAIGGAVGERTLRFEAQGPTAAVSEPFALAAGAAEALHIRVEPGGAEAGSPLDPQPVVEIRDASDNVVDDDDTTTITATIESGGGSITGSETATAEAGVATFTDLAIDGEPGERTLRFEAEGVTAAVSEPFALTASAPEALHIRVEPADASAGEPLGTPPVIEIRDVNGDVVADDNTTVITASIASGGGSISGGNATVEAGVATFTELAIDGAVGERRLRFEAQGLTAAVSEPFALAAGAAEALHIRVEPGAAEAGSPLDPQPVIEIRDASDNIVDDDDTTVITATIASGGGSITGGETANAEAGVATFTGLAIEGDAGERTLRFEAEGLTAAVSEPFTLTASAPEAEALHIRVEPGGAEAGSPLDPQPVIEIRDASDNVVDDDDATVITATITSGGGSIIGGETATVEAGVATFTGLAIDGDAGERTLRFEAEGLTAAVSEPFALTASAPEAEALHIGVEPAGARAGEPLDTPPVIEIHDANGDIIADDNSTVITASIASGGGSIVSGGSATAQAGIATFTDLAIGGRFGERTLRFRASGLGAAVSEAFALGPGRAASISLHGGSGQNAPAGTSLPVPFRIIVHDAFDNGVADVTIDWSVTAGGGTFGSDDGPTDDDGVTGVVYRLGGHAGVDTVEASASGLDGSPVEFTATATPNGRISGTVTLTTGSVSAGVLARRNEPGRTGVLPAAAAPSILRASQSAASERMLAFGTTGTAMPGEPPPRPLRSPSRLRSVPDELIVTFRAAPLGAPRIGASAYRTPTTAAAVVTSMQRMLQPHESASGMTVVGVSPAVLAARLRVDPRTIASAEAALRADPAVARVERNAIAYSTAQPLPANAAYVHPARVHAGARAALRRRSSGASAASVAVTPNDQFYFYQAWHYHMIDLPRAWDVTTGNSSVVVAVVDDGTRFDHPDIAPNLTNDGYDFVDDGSVDLCAGGSTSKAGDGDGYDPNPTTPVKRRWNDDDTCAGNIEPNGGHGLHVAGIIGAASNNGTGTTGVSWNVAIRPVRVLDITGRGTHYDIAQGLLYAAGLPADDGAGGTVAPPPGAPIINMSLAGPATSMILEDAVVAATNAGSLVIAAAGNAASPVPNYPAAYDDAVSVSAVQPDGSLASYSSFGPTIDIAAPGGETDLGCFFGVWSTTWSFSQGRSAFSCSSGTSTAAPHVAGVAALVLATQPGLGNGQLRARLIDYAVPAGNPNRYGAGIVNARNSVTRSHAPARTLFARLIDADNGATIETVMAANGSYEFTELDDGNYYVYAGEDEEGDRVIGVPVRRWGAAGGSPAPAAVTVDGAGNYPASFSIGFPLASDQPNPGLGANVLPIDGYMLGSAPAPGGVHEFLVRVPTAGAYVFETAAVSGACGFALEADTGLRLYDETSGALIASHEDIDASAGNFCARIREPLQPGTYRLEVSGVTGRYAVSARTVP